MERTQFGKYRLIELLGRGGMGEVWRAYDTIIDRMVAIKMLPAEISRDPTFQQRFRREMHATARVRSPHVIPIHTYGEINGHLFVEMPLIDGCDLQAVLRNGPLPPSRAVYIVEQIAQALHATHEAGLLHRDIKPSNILLDTDDFAYLIDFGIARATDDLGLTAANMVLGTIHYMAPERLGTDDRPVDSRSDIYSLTCVLYQCLTGHYPFPGDTMEHQITGHLVTPPPRPSQVRAEVPAGFDFVIAKGMAKNPADRYASVMELARAVRDALTTPVASSDASAYTRHANPGYRPGKPSSLPRPERAPVTTKPQSPPWWRRKVTAVSAAALLTVAAIVTVASIAFGNHGPGATAVHQTVLPFVGLRAPQGVSVDLSGTVYVADTMHDRVLALSVGATVPATLPFTGLNFPTGVTADNSGTVYVTDAGNKRVVTLLAGSTKQTELPFTDLGNPTGVTVDGSRTVYVTDTAKNQVVALDANSRTQVVLPFSGLNAPTGVVVDDRGTVYVADGGNNRVVGLPTGSDNTQFVLPFTGLNEPGGVTVDNKGDVYVTDSKNNRVLKLPTGSTNQIELPFTGLNHPWGLAVNNLGTVYVAGQGNRVLELPQRQ